MSYFEIRINLIPGIHTCIKCLDVDGRSDLKLRVRTKINLIFNLSIMFKLMGKNKFTSFRSKIA